MGRNLSTHDLTIEFLEREHLAAVAAMAVSDTSKLRERRPEIEQSLVAVSSVTTLIDEMLGGISFVALSGGLPVGYIAASAIPLFGTPGGFIPEYGFSSSDPAITHALYSVLSARLAECEDTIHAISIWAGADEGAWYQLGFGRLVTEVVRPLTRELPTSDSVRRADPGDAYGVYQLSHGLWEYLAAAPIFRIHPGPGSTQDVAARLADESRPTWVATRGGQAIGFLSLDPDATESIALSGSDIVHCDGAFVTSDARNRGVGKSLVAAAMNWADRAGFEAMALDYETANMAAAAFWSGIGFQPVLHSLVRRIY